MQNLNIDLSLSLALSFSSGGNWFVTKAVGNRPAIIGTKMTTTYYCDPKLNYMEVNIDVSGSKLGSGIFRVVKGEKTQLIHRRQQRAIRR